MLLDGCFIIEFFKRSTWAPFGDANTLGPPFNIDWIRTTLTHDLLLIENQLPFFGVEKLYDAIDDKNKHETASETTSLICHVFNVLKSLPI